MNLFSQWFRVETVDHIRGLKYIQEFKNNMTHKDKPKVTKVKGKPYTKISWIIDFKKFGMKDDFTDDMINLMIRRVYDIAGTTDKRLNVYYNRDKLKVKSFDKYIDLYIGENDKVYNIIHPRWEIGVSVSQTDKFEQYSFVNSIYTQKGGKHVDIIVKQLTSGISASIKRPCLSNRIRSPMRSFCPGCTSASHRSASNRFSSRHSTAPPLGTRLPKRRAGTTLVSLMVSRSPDCSHSGRAATVLCAFMPPSRSRTSMRASSRVESGDCAIRWGGRAKSNSATFIRPSH